jgi:hypothetical protein
MTLEDLCLAVDTLLMNGEEPLDVAMSPFQAPIVCGPLCVYFLNEYVVGDTPQLVPVKPGLCATVRVRVSSVALEALVERLFLETGRWWRCKTGMDLIFWSNLVLLIFSFGYPFLYV